eukprot:13021952-Ditylum_brightwellii.AAC.1
MQLILPTQLTLLAQLTLLGNRFATGAGALLKWKKTHYATLESKYPRHDRRRKNVVVEGGVVRCYVSHFTVGRIFFSSYFHDIFFQTRKR